MEAELAHERALAGATGYDPDCRDQDVSGSAGVRDEEVDLELLRRREQRESGGSRA